MARGTVAKEIVYSKIMEAFGDDVVGMQDKKLYVWANDGGERVQIAITLTCPKSFVEIEGTPKSPSNPVVVSFDEATPRKPAEISQEEKDNINALLAGLGF